MTTHETRNAAIYVAEQLLDKNPDLLSEYSWGIHEVNGKYTEYLQDAINDALTEYLNKNF